MKIKKRKLYVFYLLNFYPNKYILYYKILQKLLDPELLIGIDKLNFENLSSVFGLCDMLIVTLFYFENRIHMRYMFIKVYISSTTLVEFLISLSISYSSL